jgi:sporadic carbohydrate cluster protein (TIGR04323 family)
LRLQGYVTVRRFHEFCVPIPTQNLVLRDYCQKVGAIYVLPLGEHVYPNCYVQLNGLLDNLLQTSGIVMFSLFMLPEDFRHRLGVYETVLSQKKTMHFVFENMLLCEPKDIEPIENLIKLYQDTRTSLRTPKLKEALDGTCADNWS